MPYSQRFVVSILVDGKVQPENPDGSVEIPFGSEYSLRFRNKHRERRAVVKLFIDGEEQSKGGYVIAPNSSKVIERNSYSPRRFKFVAPDSMDAQDHGKDRDNVEGYNGVLEARFYLEKEQPKEVHHHHHHPSRRPYPWYGTTRILDTPGDFYYSMKSTSAGWPAASQNTFNMSNVPQLDCGDYEETEISQPAKITRSTKRKRETVAGVTVEGSHSYQTFQKVNIDLEDQFVTIKVILKGYFDGYESAEEVNEDELDVAEKKKINIP